ncbi:hypothetical protein [Raoultella planticola]|uniref:hypothetical protein n=1 Tax=Raoultella planticola TaxID=575 RepID=UPI0035244CEB
MNVLSQLIQDALNHQGGHIRTDGNGDITQFIPVTPAAVRYLSMSEVLTPKGGAQTTFNGTLAKRSLVASAGATIINIPGPMTQRPTGKTGPIALEEIKDRFVTVEAGKFAHVADDAEVTMSGSPYLVAAYDSATAPSYGVGYTLTRAQLKHEFPDDTVLLAVNTAIEKGVSDLADFVLLNHLGTAATTLADATFKGLATAAAARGLRWDEIRAIAGGDCTGLEVDGAGILRAFGARAEVSDQTGATIVGAFNRAAVAIDDEIRVTAKRLDNGAVEIVVWVNASALVPDASAFWKA